MSSITGQFVNRGFLLGPLCPIYGFGVLLVVLCLNPIKHNIVLLFFGSVFLTSLLEYVTGFILEKLFNERWWDYSDMPFNLNGYICLRFSLMWGIGCLFIVKVLFPFTEKLIDKIPKKIGLPLLIFLSLILAIDLVITLVGMLHLPKQIDAMDKTGRVLDTVEQDIGKGIAAGTLAVKMKAHSLKTSLGKNLSEHGVLKNKFVDLFKEKNFMQIRLCDAFFNVK